MKDFVLILFLSWLSRSYTTKSLEDEQTDEKYNQNYFISNKTVVDMGTYISSGVDVGMSFHNNEIPLNKTIKNNQHTKDIRIGKDRLLVFNYHSNTYCITNCVQ